jgi:2-polyprenyl-3-methyl-5-hydroxy-6-metoxy-1,4-benzoquinol methylase
MFMSEYPQEYFNREYFLLHPGKQRYVDALVGILKGFLQSGKVLDIGCGFGFFLNALRQSNFVPYGVEISPYAYAQIAEDLRKNVINQSAESPLPMEGGTLDAITLFDVIEHLNNYQDVLSECHRTLRRGGILLISTSNALSIARPILGKQWNWCQDPTHVHLFSQSTLAAAARGSGFTVLRNFTFFNFCIVGESTPFLKPLRCLGTLVKFPRFGDSIFIVCQKP